MATITKVEWIDESGKEADVTISDGTYSVVCFSCPFTLRENDTFVDKIYCLDAENIVKSLEDEPIIVKKDGFYEYLLRGKLEDKEYKIVRIGELQIDISEIDIPGDICNGDIIEFNVSRLDIY
jgi:hypothetical protein